MVIFITSGRQTDQTDISVREQDRRGPLHRPADLEAPARQPLQRYQPGAGTGLRAAPREVPGPHRLPVALRGLCRREQTLRRPRQPRQTGHRGADKRSGWVGLSWVGLVVCARIRYVLEL